MKTVNEIINLFGGLEKLQQSSIYLEVPGFMPLVIEFVGIGFRGGPLISIAHYYQQNGDTLADPDLVVELLGEEWQPVTYQQDNLSLFQEVVSVDGDKLLLRTRLMAQLIRFMQLWDRNLRDQGFLDAARQQCQGGK